jgi:hypothetical protein
MANMELGAAPLFRVMVPAGCTQPGQRRAFPRWERTFPVAHGIGVADLGCVALNLSEEGVAFATRVPYRVGSLVHLELQLPGGTIQAQGTVKHCGKGVVGVEFRNLSGDDRVRLTAFCLADTMSAPAQNAPRN